MEKKKEIGNVSKNAGEKEYEVIEIGGVKYTLKYCTAVPATSEEEDEELLQDCIKRGFLTPVFIDEYGNVIDGKRKLRFAKKLKRKDFTTKIFPGLSEAEKWQLAQDLNFHRRQLSKSEINQILQRNREKIPELALSLRVDGKSYRMIGDELGVSPETARKAVNQAATVHPETVHLPETICGKDGKKRPAKNRMTTIYAATPKEVERAIGACKIIKNRLPNGNISLKRVERLARVETHDEIAQKEMRDFQQGQVNLLLGDFRERGAEIPNSSIDLMPTDPPYEKSWLPNWVDLARFASEKLIPGGLLVTYTGSLYLLDVMNQLSKHLTYLWTGAIVHNGDTKLMPQVRMFQCWKPLLIYYKPPLNKHWSPFADIIGGSKSKEYHPWEQSVIEAAHFINGFGKRGGTLLDPCLGSGTNIVAALQSGLGLKCTGIEIDKGTFTTAQKRIQQTIDEIKSRKGTA